jgi:hypothetical protein
LKISRLLAAGCRLQVAGRWLQEALSFLSLCLMLRPMISRPVCLEIKHPSGAFCQTVAGLLMWKALSHERTGLSFTIAAGPRQRSHPLFWVSWYPRPYFTTSDSRFPFLFPPATRRATVNVFDPSSARDEYLSNQSNQSKSHCVSQSVSQ